MRLVRAHPAPAAVVLAALGAVAAVFLFARPQYRPPLGGGHAVSGTAYPAPLHGWTWRDGLPGGDMGSEAGEFLLAHVTPAELTPARTAAARAGVDPETVRPLHVARYAQGPGGFAAILAGRGAGGRTCLGFVVPGRGTSFVCPRRQQAFVVATAMPETQSPLGAGYGMFLLAIAGGEVERATVYEHTVSTDMRSGAPRVVRRRVGQVAYEKRGGWWGTFAITLTGDRPWQADVVLQGEHGRVGTLPIRMRGPGSRLFVAR